MSMTLLEKMAPVLMYVQSVDPTEVNFALISRKESFPLKFKMTVDVLFKIYLNSPLRESNFFLLSTTIILKHTSLNVFLKMKT